MNCILASLSIEGSGDLRQIKTLKSIFSVFSPKHLVTSFPHQILECLSTHQSR